MTSPTAHDGAAKDMLASFEASLPDRLRRASQIRLQHLIPAHWFATAASECANMYIAGSFYGAISVAQAYSEALSRFLAEHHRARIPKDPETRWQYLRQENIVSAEVLAAAIAIANDRDAFHHLNISVPQQYEELEAKAAQCINHLHTIESEVFAYSLGEEPGKVTLKNPDYWPSGGAGLARVNLRQRW
jgi:hypothetical protein